MLIRQENQSTLNSLRFLAVRNVWNRRHFRINFICDPSQKSGADCWKDFCFLWGWINFTRGGLGCQPNTISKSASRSSKQPASLHWKIATNVSDSLLVRRASGSSLKYCFTISATSYACWLSKLTFVGFISAIIFSLWIRERTPDFLNKPTWSRAFALSQLSASWM